MKVVIDLDEVFTEAMQHMVNPDDLRWPPWAMRPLVTNAWPLWPLQSHPTA